MIGYVWQTLGKWVSRWSLMGLGEFGAGCPGKGYGVLSLVPWLATIRQWPEVFTQVSVNR
jgi:hypothetical protein